MKNTSFGMYIRHVQKYVRREFIFQETKIPTIHTKLAIFYANTSFFYFSKRIWNENNIFKTRLNTNLQHHNRNNSISLNSLNKQDQSKPPNVNSVEYQIFINQLFRNKQKICKLLICVFYLFNQYLYGCENDPYGLLLFIHYQWKQGISEYGIKTQCREKQRINCKLIETSKTSRHRLFTYNT